MTADQAKQLAGELNARHADTRFAYQAMTTSNQSTEARALGVTPCYVRRIRT